MRNRGARRDGCTGNEEKGRGARCRHTIEGNVLGVGNGHLKLRVEDAVEDLAVDFPMIGIRPGDDVRVSF